MHRVDHMLASEGRFAGQHLIEEGANGKQVGPRVYRVSRELLWRHIGRRADDLSREGEVLHGGKLVGRLRPRESKVEQLDTELREKDV